MRLLDRLRSASSLAEWRPILDEEHARERASRIILYENTDRIEKAFVQRFPNIVERVTSGEFTAQLNGGFASILSVAGAAKTSTGSTIQTTPTMQALLLEDAAASQGTLVELSERLGQVGDDLLRYVGDGQIFAPGQAVTEIPEFGLSDRLAQHIEADRKRQEEWMNLAKDEGKSGTFVWVAGGTATIAAIASLRHADLGALGSYAPRPPFGVVGFFESGTDDLTSVAPLMVWHELGWADVAQRTVPGTVGLSTVEVKSRGLVHGEDGYPTITIRNGGQTAVSVELIAAVSPEDELFVQDTPLLEGDVAEQLGISKMFRRIGELPFHLDPGDSARWAIALRATKPPTLDNVTIVVQLSSGQILEAPLVGSV